MAYTVSRSGEPVFPDVEQDPYFYTHYGRSKPGAGAYVPSKKYFYPTPETEEREHVEDFPGSQRPALPSGAGATGGSGTAGMVGSALQMGAPWLATKVAERGALMGSSGLDQLTEGVKGYAGDVTEYGGKLWDSAGNLVTDTGKAIGSGLDSVADFFSLDSGATLPSAPNNLLLNTPIPQYRADLGAVPLEIGVGGPAEGFVSPEFGDVPKAGYEPFGPGPSGEAPLSSGVTSGFAVAGGTAIASYVGGLLQGKKWNDSNLLADSGGAGIGAGIGFALGGPIGAMVGSMVLGKWAGNAIDAIGDGIGEALEFLKFW